MIIFSGAGYTPILLQSVEFQRWRHLFKGKHNGDNVSHKLGNVDVSHPITLFLLERWKAFCCSFPCHFLPQSKWPIWLLRGSYIFLFAKGCQRLVKSTDFREKTGRHQQTISKLPKLVLGTVGGLSYMSLDLWHSFAKEKFCNEANNFLRIVLQRDYSF